MVGGDEQKTLLEIVRTWKINKQPEYRGFRCANCQEYINKAWHHWLKSGGFKLPVHLCDDKCESAFKERNIEVGKEKIVDQESFGENYDFSPESIDRFREIVSSWKTNTKPELKKFSCDECGGELEVDSNDGLRKGYHVWWRMDNKRDTLTELHFHRDCARKLGVS